MNLAHERISAEISARIKKDNELQATLELNSHYIAPMRNRIDLQHTELGNHNRRITELERGGLAPQRYRRARVITNEAVSEQDALELSPIVYVIGELRDVYGVPLWLVIEAKDGAVPTVAQRVRFE